MNAFLETHAHLVIVASLAFGIAALGLSSTLFAQVFRMRSPFRAMAALHRESGTEEALVALLKGVDENRELIREHADRLATMMEILNGCFSGMGLVRYNAFDDIGGNQSFSLCIIDRRKNGWMLTSLVGRNSTRAYAIEISEGAPSRGLSDEEKESLESALGSLSSRKARSA